MTMDSNQTRAYNEYINIISRRRINDTGGSCYKDIDGRVGHLAYTKLTDSAYLLTDYSKGEKYCIGNVLSIYEIIELYMFGESGWTK